MAKNSLERYRGSLALLTDLYQLTMSEGYWKVGLAEREAVFHLHFRKPPFKGGYAVCAGLEDVISWVSQLQFTDEDISYLSQLRGAKGGLLFEKSFLDYLANIRFSGDIDAMEEGTIAFAYEPLIRVKAPLLQCQLLETALLNLINFPTLIATKAARIATAAQGEPILEFGIRRAQGVDGALTASRAAYIGGCSATSNVLAGMHYGIPVSGTQAHSWVMAHDDELTAFEAFAKAHPNNTLLLVDTYDTLRGVERAIQVAKELREKGFCFLGIRLDSGDLAYLSCKSRKMLDEAGFESAVIVGSNDLDEWLIADLKRQGAKIAVWGVGTSLVTGKDQAALDGVYKLSAIRDEEGLWVDKLKLSEQLVKVTNPGILQVRRFKGSEGYAADAIYDIRSPIKEAGWLIDPFDATKQKQIQPDWGGQDLLKPIFKSGKLVFDAPSLEQIRQKVKEELALFYDGIKRFIHPHQYTVGMEPSLYEKKAQLIKKNRSSS